MPDRVFRARRDVGQALAGLLDRYRGRPDVLVLGCRAAGSRWVEEPGVLELVAGLAGSWFPRHLQPVPADNGGHHE